MGMVEAPEKGIKTKESLSPIEYIIPVPTRYLLRLCFLLGTTSMSVWALPKLLLLVNSSHL